MIKNMRATTAVVAFVLPVVVGCGRADASAHGYQGIVELDERVLAFEVAGRVEAIPVRRGDVVKPGDLVGKLDDTLERLSRQARADEANVATADLELLKAGSRAEEVAALAAEVVAAAAAEDLARKSAERARSLRTSGAIAQAEVDRAEAELDRAVQAKRSLEQRLAALRQGARPQEIARAQARLEAARSALELADARLARYSLLSNMEGVVLDVHIDPGELAAVGTPAATVADVTHPFVDVFVPQQEVGGIHPGTKASVRVDSSPNAVDGVVEYVSPKTEFTPRFLFSERERPQLVIRVRIRLDDPRRELHAGIPAFATFVR